MKKNVLRILLVSFLLVSYTVFSQEINKTAFGIPVNLIENSNAVVRNDQTEIIIEDIDKMIIKEKRVITFLNKLGHENFYSAVAYYDEDTKIKKINVRIYNSLGTEIKKFSKGKFTDVSAVDGGSLYDDSRMMYVDYTPTAYPYTMELEVEYFTNTTGFIPTWFPLKGYYLGVERSSYKLINNTGKSIRSKEVRFDGLAIEKVELENGFEYILKNADPVKYEASSIGFKNMVPKLKVALNTFSLKGVQGEAQNWTEFGKWMHDKLIKGRSTLDEATKAKIIALVEGVEDPVEKARLVYKFMQDKTRYISVQVGIGGWEPVAANKVDAVGYGDCKGLTNYTKALLDVAGVESYYTVVYAQERFDIDKDFACIEGNHVILNIPNGGDDIWLECTSQQMPFGFLGDFTDNRDVLVVTPEGGIIKRTPAYLNQDNLQFTKAKVTLDNDGNLTGDVLITSKGIQYDSSFIIENQPKSDLIKYYKSQVWDYNNNLEVSSVNLENDKKNVEFKEDLDVNIQGYASINNDEYIFRLNVFNRNGFVPKRYRNRVSPLKVNRGYKDVDEYTITLPENFSVTTLPQNIELDSKFGTYKMSIQKVDEKNLLYKKELFIKDGVYPKEDYDVYRKFRRKIARYENLKIALTKSKS